MLENEWRSINTKEDFTAITDDLAMDDDEGKWLTMTSGGNSVPISTTIGTGE